ncbi:MAG: ABC transporter substrate-binding protein [Saprospiraceae bacterium]|nr:ABC transporter substrate-binding protein [Saprospiraceae bacterium]
MLDPLGNSLKFSNTPQRIVCLVPSLTETLVDLGLASLLVGVTKFCIHPADIRATAKIIGGTKNPRIVDILALKPDLIIANKEENRKEDIQVLQHHIMVYVTDIKNIADIIAFIKVISFLLEVDSKLLVSELEKVHLFKTNVSLPTCYIIWKNPYMTVGQDTFIHFMMEKYGFSNLFASAVRYPEVTVDSLHQIKPQIIFLSSEPFPFNQSNLDELQLQLPESKIVLVDGEMFSWYGSRIILAHTYLKNLADTF